MDDELRLEAGKLVLFRRNGLWQARIAIGNRKYLWKSLKTSNEAEAKKAALKLFHQIEFKIDEGLPVATLQISARGYSLGLQLRALEQSCHHRPTSPSHDWLDRYDR